MNWSRVMPFITMCIIGHSEVVSRQRSWVSSGGSSTASPRPRSQLSLPFSTNTRLHTTHPGLLTPLIEPPPSGKYIAGWRSDDAPAKPPTRCAGGTLPAPLDFLYLCLQAAADRWGTLKALVDLAHWVRRQPPDWEKLAAAGERLGLARILGLTLHVLLDYFELAIPEAMLDRLDAAAAARLPRTAVANPLAPLPSLSPAATHRLRWVLRERLAHRLRYAAFLLRPTAGDLAAAPLPRGLGFLYWGVRWLRLAGVVDAGREREPALAGVCR